MQREARVVASGGQSVAHSKNMVTNVLPVSIGQASCTFFSLRPAASFRFLRLTGKLEEGGWQMAVAVGVFVEVVLMVVFCGIEVLQGLFFHGQGLLVFALLLGIDLVDEGQVGSIGEIDSRAILRAAVVTLLVDAERVYGLEIESQQELQADHLRVILDAHGFGKPGFVGTHLLVSRMGCDAIGVAYFRLNDSRHLLEVMLCAPEASSCQKDFLVVVGFHIVVILP